MALIMRTQNVVTSAADAAGSLQIAERTPRNTCLSHWLDLSLRAKALPKCWHQSLTKASGRISLCGDSW